MTVLQEVQLELREMAKLGMHVPRAALDVMTAAEAEAYRRNGMRISDIADLAINLADAKA
jgi:hypothetical protein